jgi:hypothetical protein
MKFSNKLKVKCFKIRHYAKPQNVGVHCKKQPNTQLKPAKNKFSNTLIR